MTIRERKVINYELLTKDGNIIGDVYIIKHRTHVELINLSINKQFQRQGYGRSLIQHIFNKYPNVAICLQCNAFGDGLNQDDLYFWYRRLGFVDGSPFHSDGWMHKPAH